MLCSSLPIYVWFCPWLYVVLTWEGKCRPECAVAEAAEPARLAAFPRFAGTRVCRPHEPRNMYLGRSQRAVACNRYIRLWLSWLMLKVLMTAQCGCGKYLQRAAARYKTL